MEALLLIYCGIVFVLIVWRSSMWGLDVARTEHQALANQYRCRIALHYFLFVPHVWLSPAPIQCAGNPRIKIQSFVIIKTRLR